MHRRNRDRPIDGSAAAGSGPRISAGRVKRERFVACNDETFEQWSLRTSDIWRLGWIFACARPKRCLPLWDKLVVQAISAAENDLKSGSDEYKAGRARGGYAAEGPFMSLKQMSTQILSVEMSKQPKYIDLQRMRAQQIWDE